MRVYALLELGIGAIGLVVLFGMPYVEQVYVRYAGYGLPGILLRGAVAGVCLLPPTLLMGATLPAIARWVETGPLGVSWLGFFYGGNIAGAVFGCLLAGFYLLRVYDMATATYVAVAINVTVAAIALALAAIPARYEAPAEPATTESAGRAAGAWAVYLAIALSGMSALGAEVVWTRLLSLMLGGTVYTFSLILAVFLIGLGIGSSLGALLARRAASAQVALGVCQWLLTAAIAWTAVMISQSLPYWPIVPGLSPSPWYTFQLDLMRCLWAVLPPACLWGASFPLALAAVASRGQDPGRLVGGVYAANTIGAIAGALVFSLVLVPAIGTAGAERVLIGLAAAAGAGGLVAPAPASARNGAPGRRGGAGGRDRSGRLARLERDAGAVADRGVGPAHAKLARTVGPRHCQGRPERAWLPGLLLQLPRRGDERIGRRHHDTGRACGASTAPARSRRRPRPLTCGCSACWGIIPALVHKKPESVLVVACGAGITAGSFVLHPDVKRVVICDIEPLVPTIVAPMFGTENYHVVDGIDRENPHTVNGKQVEVVYDDGRHFLRTTHEKFDIITSDPIDPWVKGCAALNTVEYYRMCRDHLNPGGSVCLWIPLYESNLDTTKSVIATFFQVFPHGIVWSNDRQGVGYDAVLFGQVEPTVIDLDELQRRLDRPDHQLVKKSLREVGFGEFRPGLPVMPEGIDLLATYAGQAPMLKEWSRGAQINTDRNLRLQYLAGMWLNSRMGEQIRSSILAHYRFPDQTFIGSPESIRILKLALFRVGRL